MGRTDLSDLGVAMVQELDELGMKSVAVASIISYDTHLLEFCRHSG